MENSSSESVGKIAASRSATKFVWENFVVVLNMKEAKLQNYHKILPKEFGSRPAGCNFTYTFRRAVFHGSRERVSPLIFDVIVIAGSQIYIYQL